MPAYQMAGAQAPQQQQGLNWGQIGTAFGGGAVVGYTADQVAMRFRTTEWRANAGLLTAGVTLGLNALGGNAAMNNANQAMSLANGVVAAGTYAQGDIQKLKAGQQQLAQGLQNLSITGYTGISASTQPTGSDPGVPASTTSNNNNGLFWLGALFLGYMVIKNN